jgi:hypothetical protein
MQRRWLAAWVGFGLVSWIGVAAQEARIQVQADQVVGLVSRFLNGACIEDVNHEIPGGLDSRRIFGESFQEPPPSVPPKGFQAFGGSWSVRDGELRGEAGDGPKLISDQAPWAEGEVGIEVCFADRRPGSAGFILRLTQPGPGADNFEGYGVSLDPAGQILRLGRHGHNRESINSGARAVAAVVSLSGSRPTQPAAEVEELAGRLEARHTAEDPSRLTPLRSAWRHHLANGQARRTFPADSFTVREFR